MESEPLALFAVFLVVIAVLAYGADFIKREPEGGWDDDDR